MRVRERESVCVCERERARESKLVLLLSTKRRSRILAIFSRFRRDEATVKIFKSFNVELLYVGTQIGQKKRN